MKRNSIVALSLLLLSVLSASLVSYSTAWGPWVYSDSVEYIFSARNLLAGNGLGIPDPGGDFHLLALHPPFYPLLLSLFGAMGADLVATARWLNIALAALTILLAGYGFYSFTGSAGLAWLLSVSLLTSPLLNYLASGAMSEPLCIALGLASIFSFLAYLLHRKLIYLIAGALAAGLSLLSRFLGASYFLAGLMMLFLFDRSLLKKRIATVLVYFSTSLFAVVAWLIWLSSQPGSGSPRLFLLRSVSLWNVLEPLRGAVVEVFWKWLPGLSSILNLRYYAKAGLLFALAAVVSLLLFLAVRKIRKSDPSRWFQQGGKWLVIYQALLVVSYLAIFAFTYAYGQPRPDLDERLFAPLQPAVLIIFFGACSLFTRAWTQRKWPQVTATVIVVAWVAWFAPQSLQSARKLHLEGEGYTSLQWRESSTIQAVEALPADMPLISNNTAAILFLTNRSAYDIPELQSNRAKETFTRFGDEPDDPVQKLFREGKAVLVVFNGLPWQFWNLYQEQSSQRAEALTEGLYLYGEYSDGKIFFYEGK